MSRQAYTAKMPWGDSLTIHVDLAQAAATIYVMVEDADHSTPTPYQTADARHRAHDAMMLALEYLGAEYYRAPDDRRDAADVLAEIGEDLEISEADIEDEE